jgi:hypothetical protein
MLEQIRNKSLNELEEMMVGFAQEERGNEVSVEDDGEEDDGEEDDGEEDDGEEDEVEDSHHHSAATSRSIMAAFARRENSNKVEDDEFDRTVSTTRTVSSRSIFVPFARKR